MALAKWEGQITVPTGGWSMTIAEDSGARSATVSVASAGDYYLTSTTSLLATIKTALDANATLSGTYTLTLDDTSDTATGKVTISVSGGASTFAVTTWDSTLLRDVLGFDDVTSDAASATGAEQAEYLWLPNTNRDGTTPEISSSTDNFGRPSTDGTYVKAPSGVAYGLYYNTTYSDTFNFQNLWGRKVWKRKESVANESLEKFWEDVLRRYKPVRYHPDRSDDAVYVAVRASNPHVSWQSVQPQVEGWSDGALSLFSFSIELDKFVG